MFRNPPGSFDIVNLVICSDLARCGKVNWRQKCDAGLPKTCFFISQMCPKSFLEYPEASKTSQMIIQTSNLIQNLMGNRTTQN